MNATNLNDQTSAPVPSENDIIKALLERIAAAVESPEKVVTAVEPLLLKRGAAVRRVGSEPMLDLLVAEGLVRRVEMKGMKPMYHTADLAVAVECLVTRALGQCSNRRHDRLRQAAASLA